MSTNTSTIEARLAHYRPALEAAILERASRPTESASLLDRELFEIDQDPKQPRRTPNRSGLLVAAAVIALVVGLGAIVATRGTDTMTPTETPTQPDAATPTIENIDDPVDDTAVVDGTAPVEVVEGSGQTRPCPSETGTVITGTLYLGGPASAQNLATDGFIFSLPAGTEPVDVAIKAIALPVLGLECGITAQPNPDGSNVSVSIEPPAAPTRLELDVTIGSTDDAVGVTSINGNLSVKITDTGLVPTVRLLDGIPGSASSLKVRFKKGDDVWELSSEPTIAIDISLAVPNGETDRFPDQPVDWVLITAVDANERIVGVAGQTIE